MKAYTEEQIRSVFWGQFYGSGELWFGDEPLPTDSEARKAERRSIMDQNINGAWADFLRALEEKK